MSQKKVSVIIPTYKRPKFLLRAIASVLCQDYENVEILVVDDNNDGDEFRNETSSFMNRFTNNPNVKYLKHVKNSNASAARNTGIKNASGDYIAFLDDDDYFLPQRISYAVDFLENSSTDVGGCCVNYIKKYKTKIYKVSNYDCTSNNCVELLTTSVDYGAGSTLMIKREVLSEIGLFDTSYWRHQDWEFLIRIFRKYKIVTLPYWGVVICADGYRNSYNPQLAIDMKEKIFFDFSKDLLMLQKNQFEKITKAQSLELIHTCLKSRQYAKGLKIYAFISKNFGSLKLNCYPQLILSAIIGVCPSFMLLVYFIFNIRYRKYHPLVKSIESQYLDFYSNL